jgi:hypothetical protein
MELRRYLPVWLALAALLGTTPAGAEAWIHPALRASLQRDPPQRQWVVWVFFRDKGLSPEETAAAVEAFARRLSPQVRRRRARVRGRPLADWRDLPVYEPYVRGVEALGAGLRHRTRWLNGASFRMSLEVLRRVAELPYVARIQPVARGVVPRLESRGGGTPPRDSFYGASYGQLAEIGVPAAHEAGFTGAGVLLMMLDTGFRKDHEAFAHADVVAEWDFVFGDGNVQNEPEDDPNAHNHGTATWGTLGGYSPGQVIGPAYNASFVLAKTEDIRSETHAEEDNYVAALEWADTLGVWMTSASLIYLWFDDNTGYGYEDLDGDTAVITVAVDIAAQKGILCVNAMGNYGPDPGTLGTPADADTIIACGAVDSLGEVTWFSSRGPTYDGRTKPELCARGLDCWAPSADGTDTYGWASGTSLSTPLIGGAAALVLEAHPEWGPVEVIEALKATGDHAQNPDNDYGWGRPDVYEAIFSQTPIYPLPFSLVAPADGSVPTLPLVLRWQASEDLDSPDPPTYTVRIWEVGAPGDTLVHAGIVDTFLVVPDVLWPGTAYAWNVWAVDADEHVRQSRETWSFVMPEGAGVGEIAGGGVPRLRVWPNPSRSALKVWWPGLRGEGFELSIIGPGGRRLLVRTLSRPGFVEEVSSLPSGVYWIRLRGPGQYPLETRWVKIR